VAERRITAEGVSGLVIAAGGGFPMWIGTTEVGATHASLWSNGWVILAAVLWAVALGLVALSWGRLAVRWAVHRKGEDTTAPLPPPPPLGGAVVHQHGGESTHQGLRGDGYDALFYQTGGKLRSVGGRLSRIERGRAEGEEEEGGPVHPTEGDPSATA